MANKSNRPKKKMPSKGMTVPKLKQHDNKRAFKRKIRGNAWKNFSM